MAHRRRRTHHKRHSAPRHHSSHRPSARRRRQHHEHHASPRRSSVWSQRLKLGAKFAGGVLLGVIATPFLPEAVAPAAAGLGAIAGVSAMMGGSGVAPLLVSAGASQVAKMLEKTKPVKRAIQAVEVAAIAKKAVDGGNGGGGAKRASYEPRLDESTVENAVKNFKGAAKLAEFVI